MFCMKCGKEIPEGAMFCMYCGTPLGQVTSASVNGNVNTPTSSKLVPAKCTNCGAGLEVDVNLRSAICPYCNSSYIVEQAINNFNVSMSGNLNVGNATINVSGVNIDNLLNRAIKFEEDGEYENALDYYNRVLDADMNCESAQNGLERVKDAIHNYVYKESSANKGFTFGKLQLQKGMVHFISNKNKKTTYLLSDIANPIVSMGTLTFFIKDGKTSVSFGMQEAAEWVDLLKNAKQGFYPSMEKPQKATELERYIMSNFTVKSKVEAIKYYREQTGASLAKAKERVEQILD